MRMLIIAQVFESIHKEDEVARLQKALGGQFGKIMESGKVESSGIFADGRGGFFVVNVDSAEEVMGLLGDTILDRMNVETHPVVQMDTLMEWFKKLEKERA